MKRVKVKCDVIITTHEDVNVGELALAVEMHLNKLSLIEIDRFDEALPGYPVGLRFHFHEPEVAGFSDLCETQASCTACAWAGPIHQCEIATDGTGTQLCPECHSNIKLVPELISCATCDWAGVVPDCVADGDGVLHCPECMRIIVRETKP